MELHPIAFRFTQDFSEAAFDWLFPILVLFVAMFFTPAVESIRLRLNRVDISTRMFEQFALDLSTFVFRAERVREYFEKGWTAPEQIDPVIDEYFAAITALRSKELVYEYWDQKFWKEDQRALFKRALGISHEVDQDLHRLNGEGDAPARVARLELELARLRRASAFMLAGP
jgi:hypothetical protein